jgi:hypothetical protein
MENTTVKKKGVNVYEKDGLYIYFDFCLAACFLRRRRQYQQGQLGDRTRRILKRDSKDS